MEAMLVREVGGFELVDTPVPEPGPDEVLVRVTVAGLCRTDLKLIEAGHRDLELPRVPGEEVVGRICATGWGDADAREDDGRPAGRPSLDDGERPSQVRGEGQAFAVGDRVYVYPGVSCGECRTCRRGAGNLCREMRIMGFHRDGGFAEYVTAPLRSLIRLPEGLSDEEAVFAEPLSCCLNALELGGVRRGDVLGIWGAGPAGTLLARVAEKRGAHVIVVEPDARRRERIDRRSAVGIRAVVGPPTGCVDVAIVAVGSAQAYAEAFAALGPRGRLVVFSGLSPADDAALRPSLNQLHYREQTVVGAYGCAFLHGVEALDLLASGDLPVADLVSHRLPLADLGDGLDIVAQRTGMKVHLYPGGEPPSLGCAEPRAPTPTADEGGGPS